MKRRLGKLSVYHLFDWRNRVGDTIRETIESFLKDGDVGEQVAARWIEAPKGVMILQMVKGDPECGGIFVFDRQREQWYMLDFDRCNHRITPALFDRIVCEYKLFSYIEQPGLLLSHLRPARH